MRVLRPAGILLLVFGVHGFAQDIEWTNEIRQVGDASLGIGASESGAFVVGAEAFATLNVDAFATKVRPDGSVDWNVSFGSGPADLARAVAVDASGAYLAGRGHLGLTDPSGDSFYDRRGFVRKLSNSGTVEWTDVWAKTNPTDVFLAIPESICAHSSGIYAGGTITGLALSDAILRKYSLDGSPSWTVIFGHADLSVHFTQIVGVSADDSGVYVAGISNAALPSQTHSGDLDVFVRKYSLGGAELWTRQFGTAVEDRAAGISITGDGVCVTGRTFGALPGQSNPDGGVDGFLRKYDRDGNELWTRQIDNAEGTCLTSRQNDVYVGGNGSSGFVRKFDSAGATVWTQVVGPAGAKVVGIASTGSAVIVTGPSSSSPATARPFVAKIVDGLAPIAKAGSDQTVECTGSETTVTLNGSESSDPEGAALIFEWKNSAGQVVGTTTTTQVNLPLGNHSFTLRVFDGALEATDSVTVVVRDTTAPAITQPVDVQVACNVSLLVPVTYQFTVSDPGDPNPTVVATPPSGSGFPIGTTPVTVVATDARGNTSSSTFNVIRQSLGFSGFSSPLGGADASGGSFTNPLRAFKLKSKIPIKFSLECEGQAVVTGVHTLAVTKFSSETTQDEPIDATPNGEASSGNQFLLAETSWKFHLDVEGTGMTSGVWLLTATLSDGSKHSAWIQVK